MVTSVDRVLGLRLFVWLESVLCGCGSGTDARQNYEDDRPHWQIDEPQPITAHTRYNSPGTRQRLKAHTSRSTLVMQSLIKSVVNHVIPSNGVRLLLLRRAGVGSSHGSSNNISSLLHPCRKRPLSTTADRSVVGVRHACDIPSFSRRWFDSSAHYCGPTTSVVFDPFQYPSSAALLKQQQQQQQTSMEDTGLLSPHEQELKACLHDYQERPNDLDTLDALQQAYSVLEYWEEALAVEQHKCNLLPSSDSDDYVDSIHMQGKLWLRQGNFEASKPLYEQALAYFQTTNNQVQEGHALISLAGWYFFQQELTQDHTSLQTAMEYLTQAESKLDSNPALLVKCLDNQGLICRLQGDYETALDKYQQALQVVVDPQTRHALQLHLADMKLALEEPQHALVLYQELLHEFQEDTSNNGTMESMGMQGVLWHNIASIHVQMGQLDVAEQGFREALRLKEESAGRDDHPELAKTWNALGALYYGVLNEKEQALECFRHVLWITRSHSSHDDPRTDPDVLAAIQTISDIQQSIDRERQGTN